MMRHRLQMSSILLVCSILCFGIPAESQVQQSDLVNFLRGKTVSSLIVVGGSGAPAGYSGNYPVNTLAYPDGQLVYRVEFGIMRGAVGFMTRRYPPGTLFEISSVEVKDNRLELRLTSRDRSSGRLKLMLGAKWQKTMTNAAVLQVVSQFLTLPSLPPPPRDQASQLPSSAVAVDRQPQFSYQRPAAAKEIPGRPTASIVSGILQHLQHEINQARQQLVQSSLSTATGLHAFQATFSGVRDFGAQREVAEIVILENRMGPQLVPATQSDIEALNATFLRCRRLAELRQTEDGTGREVGPGGNDPQYVDSFLRNNGLRGQDTHAQDISELQTAIQRIEQIRRIGESILGVERTLDEGDFASALEGYRDIEKSSSSSTAAEEYLTASATVEADLASYANARALAANPADLSAIGLILLIRKEESLLKGSPSPSLTSVYLTSQISARKDSLKAALQGAPQFSLTVADSTGPRTIDKQESRLAAIRTSLSNSPLTPVFADAQALPDIQRWFGNEVYEGVVQKGSGIGKAEHDAALLEAQIQAQQAAEREEAEQRERAAEERANAASDIVNTALLITKLDEQFQQTQIMGYSIEAEKQRQKFASLVRTYRSTAVWTEVQARFQQILPGLTVWEAGQMERLISFSRP